MSRMVKRISALVSTACLLTSLLWAASVVERPSTAGALSPGWTVEGQTNLNPNAFNSVSCPSTRVCYAVEASNNSSEILKTQNLGASWTSSSIPFQPHIGGAQISCVSVTECYAVFYRLSDPEFGISGITSFFATTDSGNTWTEESSPGPNFWQLSCTGPGVCMAATSVSMSTSSLGLTETTDGGIDWTQSNLSIASYSDNFTAFSCSSSTQCIFLSAAPITCHTQMEVGALHLPLGMLF